MERLSRLPGLILALINNKGGVGKTTVAVNLAAALALTRRRVLLVDLDSQASASLSLGVAKSALAPSSADVLLEAKSIASCVRSTSSGYLDLLTASRDLASADLLLSGMKSREHQLKAALDPARIDYSYILLDAPPSLSLLTVNALVAADGYVVPVTPQYLALEGLVALLDSIDRVKEATRSGGALVGVLLSMVDYRMRAPVEIAEMIRSHYRTLVFSTELRANAKLAEAPSFGQTIFEYSPHSGAADAFQRLAGEVLQRARHAPVVRPAQRHPRRH